MRETTIFNYLEVRDPLAINEMADADMEVYECEVGIIGNFPISAWSS